MSEERKGDWLQTSSGIAFWPLDPRPEEVEIQDIAHALSNMCRYGGHCREFYSVAQHSVLVSQALSPEYKLWGLLHDAGEAYVVDIPRPLKRFLTNYAEIEKGVMNAVCDKFDMARKMPDEVKRVDNAILADEMPQLMKSPPRPWNLIEPPLGITIRPWTSAEANIRFLSEFRMLTGILQHQRNSS